MSQPEIALALQSSLKYQYRCCSRYISTVKSAVYNLMMLRLKPTARFFSAVNVRYESQRALGSHVSFRRQATSRDVLSKDVLNGTRRHLSDAPISATRLSGPDQNIDGHGKRVQSRSHNKGLDTSSPSKLDLTSQKDENGNISWNGTNTETSQYAKAKYHVDIAFKFSAPRSQLPSFYRLKKSSSPIAALLSMKTTPLFPVFTHVLSGSKELEYLQRSLPLYARHQTKFSVSVRELPTASNPDSFAVAYGLQNTTHSRQHADIKIDFLWPMSTNQGFWSLRTGGRREMLWSPDLPTSRVPAPQITVKDGEMSEVIEGGKLNMEVTAICYWIRHVDDTSDPAWIELPFLGKKPKPVVRDHVDAVEDADIKDDAMNRSEDGSVGEEPATEDSAMPSTDRAMLPTRYEKRRASFPIEDERRRLEYLGQLVKVKTVRKMAKVMMKLPDESEALKAQQFEEEMQDGLFPPYKRPDLGPHAQMSETRSEPWKAAGPVAQYAAETTDSDNGSDGRHFIKNPKEFESKATSLRDNADFQRKLQEDRDQRLWEESMLKGASPLEARVRKAIENGTSRRIPDKTVDLADDDAVHIEELISTSDIDDSQPRMQLTMSKNVEATPTDQARETATPNLQTPTELNEGALASRERREGVEGGGDYTGSTADQYLRLRVSPSANQATIAKTPTTSSLELPTIPPRPRQHSPSISSSDSPRPNYEYQRMLSARMARASRLSASKPPTVVTQNQSTDASSNFINNLVNPYRHYRSLGLTRDMVQKPEYGRRHVRLDDRDFFSGNDAAESITSASGLVSEPTLQKDYSKTTGVLTTSRQLDLPASLVSTVDPVTESYSQIDDSSIVSQATNQDIRNDTEANELSTTKAKITEQGKEHEKLDPSQNDDQDYYSTAEAPRTRKLVPASNYYKPRPKPGILTYAESLTVARAERDLGDGFGPRPRISYFPSRRPDPAEGTTKGPRTPTKADPKRETAIAQKIAKIAAKGEKKEAKKLVTAPRKEAKNEQKREEEVGRIENGETLYRATVKNEARREEGRLERSATEGDGLEQHATILPHPHTPNQTHHLQRRRVRGSSHHRSRSRSRSRSCRDPRGAERRRNYTSFGAGARFSLQEIYETAESRAYAGSRKRPEWQSETHRGEEADLYTAVQGAKGCGMGKRRVVLEERKGWEGEEVGEGE
ncbi:hypothetical protein VTL71DRAFT_9695 [Oculimacula yallundae]|uniref:Uncharacterized protein n=1 Tax=Oculimacula yallundae TaxID=86028 RepID=A0ABR4BRR7_9HELO